jgi:predicted Zn-dependent protease
VKTIEPPDSHYFSAAQGWMELGCPREAVEELAKIGPAAHAHPQVLQLRWQILAKDNQWESCLAIGRTMVQADPDEPFGWINRANALFYLKRYQEAYDALWPALERFPKNPFLHYNLACYTCQLGQLSQAMEWFRNALQLGDQTKLKEMALSDPDLSPLWEELRDV